jgi:hypothetical protein
MISITFTVKSINEAKAAKILDEIGIAFVKELGKATPSGFAPPAMGAIYRRIGTAAGEPSLSLLSRGLEHYVWAGATAIDEPPYTLWVFDIQSPDHVLAIVDKKRPTIRALVPDQVSTLFRNLAQRLSELVDVEVSYDDDHARHGVIFHHGTPTKDEHW